MIINLFSTFREYLKINYLLYLLLLSVYFLVSQPRQAIAEEPLVVQRDVPAFIGRTTLKELLMRHPNVSQVTKKSSGTSIIYAYKNASNHLASKSLTQTRGANAIELEFDGNQALSAIYLIEVSTSK